jgi:spore coat protein U-like protein
MNRRCRGRHVAWLLLLALIAPTTSWALLESCTVSATPLPFGVYGPTSASPTDATGTVTVTCDVSLIGLLASWSIGMSPGGSASYAPRRLSSGPATLSYNLYTSSARTTVWGDGSAGTAVVSDSQTLLIGSNTKHYTVYGRIPPLQDVRAGSYSDSIVVTVMY